MGVLVCDVPRRKGFASPVTEFVNIEQILAYTRRHPTGQRVKPEPNQIDPKYWVYDIGENSDCGVDAPICDNVYDFVALFRNLPNANQVCQS